MTQLSTDQAAAQARAFHADGSEALDVPDPTLRFLWRWSPIGMGAFARRSNGDLVRLHDNPAARRLLGIGELPHGSGPARRLVAPAAVISLWGAKCEEAAARAQTVSFEYSHPHRDGARALAVSLAPLPASQTGAGRYFCYVAKDVSDLHAMASALAASEARLQLSLAAGRMDAWEYDLKTGEISRSANAEQFFGPGRTAPEFHDRLQPADAETDRRYIMDLMEGRRDAYEQKFLYHHPDGRRMWVHNRGRLHRDANGRPARIYGVSLDITESRAAEESRRDAQERLALATQASGLGVWAWELESNTVHYSDRAQEIRGLTASRINAFEDIALRTHPDDLPRVREVARRARDPSSADRRPLEYRILHPERGLRWVRVYGAPVLDQSPDGGRLVRHIGTIEDITEERRNREKLMASEARLRLATEAGRMAVFEWPLDQPQPQLTPEIQAQLGLSSRPPDGAEQVAIMDPSVAAAARDRATSGQDRFVDFEFRHTAPDGQARWLQVRSELMRSETGGPDRLVGLQQDITAQKTDAERLNLLSREVDHRANNLLAVVQGLVALSDASDVGALREALTGRITALARAHQLLAESRWRGADLQRLVHEELRPFGLEGSAALTITGPCCALSAPQAQAMSMALHELATNAVKYGALSTPAGSLTVRWRILASGLEMDWVERGGPSVVAPERKGFGTKLLMRALAGQLRGRVKLTWAPAGLRARLVLPLADAQT